VDRFAKAVLAQGDPGQPVVPAFPLRMFAWQWLVLDAVHPADPAGQRLGRKVVGAQATSGSGDGVCVGIHAAAKGRRGGERSDG
jgi:hypothetical protein